MDEQAREKLVNSTVTTNMNYENIIPSQIKVGTNYVLPLVPPELDEDNKEFEQIKSMIQKTSLNMNNAKHENLQLEKTLDSIRHNLHNVTPTSTEKSKSQRFNRLYPHTWYHKDKPTMKNLCNVVQNKKLIANHFKRISNTARKQATNNRLSRSPTMAYPPAGSPKPITQRVNFNQNPKSYVNSPITKIINSGSVSSIEAPNSAERRNVRQRMDSNNQDLTEYVAPPTEDNMFQKINSPSNVSNLQGLPSPASSNIKLKPSNLKKSNIKFTDKSTGGQIHNNQLRLQKDSVIPPQAFTREGIEIFQYFEPLQ